MKTNIQYMMDNLCHKHTGLPTFSPFGQLSGKQNVGQLALCVGLDRMVILLTAQVIKRDLAHVVSY